MRLQELQLIFIQAVAKEERNNEEIKQKLLQYNTDFHYRQKEVIIILPIHCTAESQKKEVTQHY